MQSNEEDATIVQHGTGRHCCYLSNFFEGARYSFPFFQINIQDNLVVVIGFNIIIKLTSFYVQFFLSDISHTSNSLSGNLSF